jgi:integrase
LAEIGREDVLAALLPIWESKNVTAARSRERLERLFSHAIQNGAYTGDNPAAWSQFDHTLTPPKKLTRGHHAALPHPRMPEFLLVVRARQGGSVTALMLEFIALAACRTGEARFATWDEIDEGAMVWTIPPERMKMRRGHVVPITPRMAEILVEAKRHGAVRGGSNRHVFLNDKGVPLSEMASLMLMRRLPGFERFTVHGLRATFKSWAATETEYPRELIEEQLAHQLGPVERAYMRGSAVERRRPMMEHWAAMCAGEDTSGTGDNLVALTRGR